MAAAQRTPREEVKFAPNVPVTLALRYSEPKVVPGMSGERCMYSTTDNRVLFLDREVAAKVVDLGVNVREPFTIEFQWDGKKDSPRTWRVSRPLGQQPDGTFVVPAAQPGGARRRKRCCANANRGERSRDAETSGSHRRYKRGRVPAGAPHASTANGLLVAESIALVDAYAEVLAYSLDKYQGRVKPDEIQRLLTTAYIQRRQLSSVA